jgi:hypothetical protein
MSKDSMYVLAVACSGDCVWHSHSWRWQSSWSHHDGSLARFPLSAGTTVPAIPGCSCRSRWGACKHARLPHIPERNTTPHMRMTEEKHVLVLNTVIIYLFSNTRSSSIRSSPTFLLLSLSISLLINHKTIPKKISLLLDMTMCQWMSDTDISKQRNVAQSLKSPRSILLRHFGTSK